MHREGVLRRRTAQVSLGPSKCVNDEGCRLKDTNNAHPRDQTAYAPCYDAATRTACPTLPSCRVWMRLASSDFLGNSLVTDYGKTLADLMTMTLFNLPALEPNVPWTQLVN